MSGGVAVTQYDNDPLVYGTQKGSGATITDIGMDFKSCGVSIGLSVRNITTAASGHVTGVTEDTVTTDITFAYGALYEIYKTDTYNAILSTVFTDRRFGHKVTDRQELENGLFPEDIDVDEHGSNIFGPDEPWETRV